MDGSAGIRDQAAKSLDPYAARVSGASCAMQATSPAESLVMRPRA